MFLAVTAEAVFDQAAGVGQVRHFGHRLGMKALWPFVDAEKAGAKAPTLIAIYDGLRDQFGELPNAILDFARTP